MPIDASPFVIAKVDGPQSLALTFDGANYVAAWTTWEGEVAAARVSPTGTVLDAQPITVASYPGCKAVRTAPGAAVFDGTRALFAWSACGPQSLDVFGAKIAQDGAVTTFSITADDRPDIDPALAAAGKGLALAAYSSYRWEAPLSTYRVFARVVSWPACADAADCASGFCVDGVCCDSACGGGDPTDCMACSEDLGAPVDGVCAPLSGTACGTEAGVCMGGVCTSQPSGTGGGGSSSASGGGTGGMGTGGMSGTGGADDGPIPGGGCACRTGNGAASGAQGFAGLLLGALTLRRRQSAQRCRS
jgi:MYXO-CTERM domain-containing protein